MAIIGTFTKQDDGYRGAVATLALKGKVNITAIPKTGDKAPDFRVFAGTVEIGAAWSMTSKEDKPYLSVKLDDPSFPAAILCRLVNTEHGYVLVWNR